MKRFAVVAVFTLAGWVATGVAATAAAQEKAQDASQARWSGTIIRLNDKTSTITVRKGHIEKIIHYDDSTKWTKGTGSADRSKFKEGARVICLGKYDEKKEFVADRVDLRESHMVPMP